MKTGTTGTKVTQILLLLAILTISAHCKEVDSFNLLLPTSYHASKWQARQIVITSGDCYDWDSTDASIVKVQGTHHGLVPSETASRSSNCHSNAIVQLAYVGLYPSSVYITAKDRASLEVISIPVRIRDLRRVSIFTKSKIMNIREIQNLELKGFDSENNTFTSLEGLTFRWTIIQISDGASSTGSIEKIPLRESSLYMPLDTRKALESELGAETDLLVIRALQVGKVSVKVRCTEPHYEHITEQIILYIQEKFEISPGLPVHVLAGSTFQYSLLTPSGLNKTLPQTFYRIQLSNPEFTSTDELVIKTPRATAETTITVRDIRTEPAFSQVATIHSHQPDSIEIIVPEQVTLGQSIPFNIKFYSNKRLLQGKVDPYLLKVDIEEKPFSAGDRVFHLDRQNQRIDGFNKGSGVLKVTYNGLTAEKTVHAITPLKLVSQNSRVILPIGEMYQLRIVGGSGLYKFSQPIETNEQDLITISFNGMVSARKEGAATVLVSDEKNPGNQLTIKILILKVEGVKSIESHREFNLNQEGSLYLTAWPKLPTDASATYFTECNDILLRGVSIGIAGSQPLQVISNNPISYQTLSELLSYGQQNKSMQKLLQSRTTIDREELAKEYYQYVRAGELKQSDLDRFALEMQNYGICAKIVVRPTAKFDGQVTISRNKEEQLGSQLNLRVYEPLTSNILGLNSNEVVMTPLASFKWSTQGGPFSWTNPAIGKLEVSLNNVKLDPSRSSKQQYLYPIVTCTQRQSESTHMLTYANPASQLLPRPVEQSLHIAVKCKLPTVLRVGLPSKIGDKESQRYILNDKNSTIHVLDGQCFRVTAEPLYGSTLSGLQRFYNSSNVDIGFEQEIGKTEDISGPQSTTPESWNVRTVKYTPRGRKNSAEPETDHLTIRAKRIIASPALPLTTPLEHSVAIVGVPALTLSSSVSSISLPSHPDSSYTISLNNPGDSSRFSVICDDSAIKCRKVGNNQIQITPSNVDKTQGSVLTIVDEWALGNPRIQIPVTVAVVDGVDLRIARPDKPFSRAGSSTWVVQGQEFTAYINIFSFNSSSSNPKQPTANINPSSITVAFPSGYSQEIVEVARRYNPENKQVEIRYRVSGRPGQQEPSKVRFTANFKSNSGESLISNTATIEIYLPLRVSGTSASTDIEQVQISGKDRQLSKQIHAYAYIMESCSTVLEIQGGPASLSSRAVVTSGDGKFYRLVKLSEQRYRLQSLKPTTDIESKQMSDSIFKISGRENNLFQIAINADDGTELAVIKCLVFVKPLKNFSVQGNSKLLSGRSVRYLVQFGDSSNGAPLPLLKSECSLNYKWSLPTSSPLSLQSDPTKLGVNITTSAQPQAKQTILSVTIYNQYSHEVGTASKPIQVVLEEKVNINDGQTIGSDEVMLIPPHSALNLPSSVYIEQATPCARDDDRLAVQSGHVLVSGDSSSEPELLKVQYSSTASKGEYLGKYLHAQVTQICTAVISNVDGSVSVDPYGRDQILGFRILDCYGRPFNYYDFKHVEYRVSVANPSLATARITDRSAGHISIEGHRIGESQLVLQVLAGGVVKARDIVPIIVNQFMHPAKPVSVHIGDIINFSVPAGGPAEKWSSTDTKILKINANSGQAVASSPGQTHVKFGAMSTRVSVVKLIDIVQQQARNGYVYQLVYEGNSYQNSEEDTRYINKQIKYRCEVLGKQGNFLRGTVVSGGYHHGKDALNCVIEKIPGTETLQTPVRALRLRIIAENTNTGFSLSKQFEQTLDIFMIVSERHVNPSDPRIKRDKNTHMVVVQTSERLDYDQTGGRDSWIVNSEFNGMRQIITLDLTHYRGGEWRINLHNPRTKQSDSIVVSPVEVKKSKGEPKEIESDQGWKWVDILVVVMAVNFLLIVGYQIMQNKSKTSHAKIY